jgi:DNA-3-methyladenine glycosylase
MEFTALPRSFYAPSAEKVAAKLLGHWLIRNTARGPCGGAIVETEAYLQGDAACHAFNGRTARNRVMWQAPGHCYVYFIYGNHWCVNAVCRPVGIAEAVLIRALEPLAGLELMREFRPVDSPRQLTNGPGKLCAALDIGRDLDGVDLCDTTSPLFIAENKSVKTYLREHGPRVVTTRIGITRAAELPLRFCLAGSEFVSRQVREQPRMNADARE